MMPSWPQLTTRDEDDSDATDSRIPPQIKDAVPVCARACLNDYIEKQYNPNCTGSSCVCGVYSSGLFSLGELALKCVKGPDCSGQTISEQAAVRAFQLCSAEVGAVPGYHTTLTVRQPTRITSSSRAPPTASGTVIHTSSHTNATRTSIQVPSSQTALATTSNSLGPAVTSALEVPETANRPISNESSALTSAQAVGVAIGAVSGVIIIIAVIYLLACIRRRRSKKQTVQRHSYDFIDEGPANGTPSPSDAQRPQPSVDKHHTLWPSQGYTDRQPMSEKADHYNHSSFHNRDKTRSSESAMSNASMRTLSQLLPERPRSKPPPPPSKSSFAPLIRTPATIFEEEDVAPRVVLQGLPAHPAVMKVRQPRTHQAPSQPVLSIQIPRQHTRAPSTHSVGDWPLPPAPVLAAPFNDGKLSGCSAAFSSSKTSLLDYYASADSGSSPQDLNSPTPIDEASQVRRPAPAAITITQPSYQMRATRDSVASDTSRRTSFESTNGDELTPPEEDDKRLSPVVESPISNVRYPRVPRSSNQAIPRSPVYSGTTTQHPTTSNSRVVTLEGDQKLSMHKPTGSGSTLAARRRGDTAPEQLYIANSAYNHDPRNNSNSAGIERHIQNHRQQSPLKGYGRTKSQPRQMPSYPLTVETRSPGSLKSPLWEPKMTPSRKGDDLYLSVSVATPQASHFHDLYDRY